MATPAQRRSKRRAPRSVEPLPDDVSETPITIGMLNEIVALLVQLASDAVTKAVGAELAVVLQSQRDVLALLKQQDVAHTRAVRRLKGMLLASTPPSFGLRGEGIRALDVLEREEARDPAPDLSGMHDLREQADYVTRRVDGGLHRS